LPDLLERPSFSGKTGFNGCLNACNFRFIDRDRVFADSHYLNHSPYYEYWHAIKWIEPAKQIAWKQRQFDFLNTVRPPASRFVHGQERFVSSALQLHRDHVFMPAPGLQREPRPSMIISRC
jgi:hypothetical protein